MSVLSLDQMYASTENMRYILPGNEDNSMLKIKGKEKKTLCDL